MSRSFTRRSLAGLVVAAAVVAGCGDDDNNNTTATVVTEAPVSTPAETAAAAAGDVLEVAASEGDVNTFLTATEAAGIMDGLHGDGPFTVFMPTDAAFGAYFEEAGMSQAEVFGDAAMLRKLVENHIVNMSEDSEMVMSMAGQALTTAAGTSLDVVVDGDTVMIGDATVVRYDIQASNGVIHVIDTVLLPPAG